MRIFQDSLKRKKNPQLKSLNAFLAKQHFNQLSNFLNKPKGVGEENWNKNMEVAFFFFLHGQKSAAFSNIKATGALFPKNNM